MRACTRIGITPPRVSENRGNLAGISFPRFCILILGDLPTDGGGGGGVIPTSLCAALEVNSPRNLPRETNRITVRGAPAVNQRKIIG